MPAPKIVYCIIGLMGIFSIKSKAQQATEAPVQVIILRHAEKEPLESADPDLSEKGKQRAGQLATLLQDVPVTELYATTYKRTQQTLAPLAAAKQVTVQTYNPGQLQELANMLLTRKGKTIVVAGHANTSPQLVNLLLGEDKYATLSEDDFGKIWFLTLSNGKALSCQLLNTN